MNYSPGTSLRECPICHSGRMVIAETLAPLQIAHHREHLAELYHRIHQLAASTGLAYCQLYTRKLLRFHSFESHPATSIFSLAEAFDLMVRSPPLEQTSAILLRATSLSSFGQDSANHSIPIGQAVVRRFSPIHF